MLKASIIVSYEGFLSFISFTDLRFKLGRSRSTAFDLPVKDGITGYMWCN